MLAQTDDDTLAGHARQRQQGVGGRDGNLLPGGQPAHRGIELLDPRVGDAIVVADAGECLAGLYHVAALWVPDTRRGGRAPGLNRLAQRGQRRVLVQEAAVGQPRFEGVQISHADRPVQCPDKRVVCRRIDRQA